MSTGKLLPFRRTQGTTEELSDRALVSAIGEGDQAALGALFDRFQRDVHRFVTRIARGGADVDDLVQMTFLEAYRSAPRFRGDSAVKTWLLGIAVNLVRHHVRDEMRRRNAGAVLSSIPSVPAAIPGEALGREQQRHLVAAAVELLAPSLREAYVLCVIEEMPGKQAAEVLGIREASLWRRLSDARSALRAALEEVQR